MHRQLIRHHSDWELYGLALEAAMAVFESSKRFPTWEQRTLVEPLQTSARTLCVVLAQAWRKRLDDGIFRAKLDEAEMLAAGTQSWLELACRCDYLSEGEADCLIRQYGQIMGKIAWSMPVAVSVDR